MLILIWSTIKDGDKFENDQLVSTQRLHSIPMSCKYKVEEGELALKNVVCVKQKGDFIVPKAADGDSVKLW